MFKSCLALSALLTLVVPASAGRLDVAPQVMQLPSRFAQAPRTSDDIMTTQSFNASNLGYSASTAGSGGEIDTQRGDQSTVFGTQSGARGR